MDHTEFLNTMAEVLQVEPSELVPSFELTENNFDSLALISTIALVDEHYGITLNIDRLSSCTSLKMLLDLIQEKSAK